MYDGYAAQQPWHQNRCADLPENQSYSTACLALTDWASMGASKGPWLSRDSLGLQKDCGSAARPVHWVTLHLAEGSVLSAKGEGEEPAMEMVSSTSHSPHISFGKCEL